MRKWFLIGGGALTLLLAASGYALLNANKDSQTGAAAPGAPASSAPSRIVKVTVYPNSALVTREVEVPAGQGLVELVVPDLPVRTVNSSLYSEGSEGLRVLSTRFRSKPVLEDTREDVRKLEDELEKLRLSTQKVKSDMDALSMNLKTLDSLEKFTAVTTVASTEKGGLNGDSVITMAKYVMEQRAEKARELVALQQQFEKNAEQTKFARRKLNDLTAGSTRIERDAVLIVDRDNGGAGGGRVRLNYLVDAVTWSPQYKLRAGKTSEPVDIDYLAAITQQTGEDWTGVEMSLSTAQPMLSAAPPDLARLEVAVVNRASLPASTAQPREGGQQPGGPPLPKGAAPADSIAPGQSVPDLQRQAQQLRSEAYSNSTKLKVEDANRQFNAAAAADQTWELMLTQKDLKTGRNNKSAHSNEGPSVTYHLKSRMTVPSRKDEQVLEVAKLKLEPRYYYKAVPVLTRHVYRLADLANKSELVFLPGEATMYQGRDFVGRMTMPLVAIGEEFTAGFGVDPQLQVQREMLDMAKGAQGGNQVLNYKYRILVSSFKAEPVQLQVWDRLPHAETETAGITLVKASHEVSKDELYQRESRPHNLLRWDVSVEPKMNGVQAMAIGYEFKLELDRNLAIGSLLSK